jgi:hypothetical protein
VAKKSEIQSQIDALTAQLDSADPDEDTELWVRDEKGRETRLTGSNAQKWLKGLGLVDDEAPPADGGGDGGTGNPPADPPPPSGNRYFKSKNG